MVCFSLIPFLLVQLPQFDDTDLGALVGAQVRDYIVAPDDGADVLGPERPPGLEPFLGKSSIPQDDVPLVGVLSLVGRQVLDADAGLAVDEAVALAGEDEDVVALKGLQGGDYGFDVHWLSLSLMRRWRYLAVRSCGGMNGRSRRAKKPRSLGVGILVWMLVRPVCQT